MNQRPEAGRDRDAGLSPGLGGRTIFVGHARLPQGLSATGLTSIIALELETDLASGQILSAAASGVPPLAQKLLQEILVGRSVQDGFDAALTELQRRYVSPAQKALASAVANAFEAYLRYRRQQELAERGHDPFQ